MHTSTKDEREESPAEYIDTEMIDTDEPESRAATGSQSQLQTQKQCSLKTKMRENKKGMSKIQMWKDPDVCERDHTITKIATLQYLMDPSHVDTYQIKCKDRYISMCCSVGPCQPDMPYPKNAEGRSFQKQWFSGNVWLEYSTTANSIHCFSCRLFLSEEKYKNRTAWTTDGIRKWNRAGLDEAYSPQIGDVFVTVL